MVAIQVLAFRTETGNCSRCSLKLPTVLAGWFDDKDCSCERCGCTSIKNPRDGRVIGPKSQWWELICEILGIDPDTGMGWDGREDDENERCFVYKERTDG